MSPKDAIMEIVKEIDTQLLGRGNQRLKGIPSLNSLSGTRLQAHIAFAYTLSGPQLRALEFTR